MIFVVLCASFKLQLYWLDLSERFVATRNEAEKAAAQMPRLISARVRISAIVGARVRIYTLVGAKDRLIKLGILEL